MTSLKHNHVHLSVIVPMFNEEDCIHKFLDELYAVINKIPFETEVIVVDDCSSDRTREILLLLDHPNLDVITHAKNLGHSCAIWTGMKAAIGDLLLTLDGDLQHPPQLIPEMIDALNHKQADVVYGIRKDFNTERLRKRLSTHTFFFLSHYIYGLKLEPYANDFRLLKREVLQRVASDNGRCPTLRAALPRLKLNASFVEFDLGKRFAGSTKFTFTKMADLFLNTISYSDKKRLLLLFLSFFGLAIVATSCYSLFFGLLLFSFSLLFQLPFFQSVYLCLKKLIP
jgi:glycosyltransferase involved in cell wall biosynthesis